MDIDNIKRLNNYLKFHNIDSGGIFLQVLNNAFDIIIFKTPDYKNIWINRDVESLFNGKITEKDFMEKQCYHNIYNRKDPCPDCIIEKIKKSKKIEKTKFHVPEPDNNTYLVKAFPVMNKNNNLVGCFLLLLKISKRKKLQEKVKRERSKINFFTNLSHELRTPLSLMHSSFQIMKNHYESSSLTEKEKNKFKKYLYILKQNNYRLLKLINNLLDINKIDSGQYRIKLKNMDIVDTIKENN